MHAPQPVVRTLRAAGQRFFAVHIYRLLFQRRPGQVRGRRARREPVLRSHRR